MYGQKKVTKEIMDDFILHQFSVTDNFYREVKK